MVLTRRTRRNLAPWTVAESSGSLPGGKSFQGAAQLKSILVQQRSKIGRNLAQKLLTYGLGRGLEHYDRRSIAKIQAALEQNDYKFSTLAIEIVKSEPFRMRRGTDEEQRHK